MNLTPFLLIGLALSLSEITPNNINDSAVEIPPRSVRHEAVQGFKGLTVLSENFSLLELKN